MQLNRSRNLHLGDFEMEKRLRLLSWLRETGNISVASRVCTILHNGEVESTYNSEFRLGNSEENEYPTKLVHFGSYNYSGLNRHPEVIEAAKLALEKYGTSTSGVRVLNGTIDLHLELESALAKFLGKEAAVLYSTGYDANLAVLSTVLSPKDVVISDQASHRSINEGLILSGAKIRRYRHNDMEHLEFRLSKEKLSQRKFIIADGVFSMDGDICDLPSVISLAEKYNAFVMIDDAHALAAIGKNGRGTCSHFGGLEDSVDLITGSFSKGIPGIGGFAAGSRETIGLLKYASGPYMFSASLPGPIVAAILKSIELLIENPNIQDDLFEKTNYFRNKLQSLGFDTMLSETPIVPILLKDRDLTFKFVKEFHKKGVYVNPVCYPAVSAGTDRIRTNVSAALSYEQLDIGLGSFEQIGREFGVI